MTESQANTEHRVGTIDIGMTKFLLRRAGLPAGDSEAEALTQGYEGSAELIRRVQQTFEAVRNS